MPIIVRAFASVAQHIESWTIFSQTLSVEIHDFIITFVHWIDGERQTTEEKSHRTDFDGIGFLRVHVKLWTDTFVSICSGGWEREAPPRILNRCNTLTIGKNRQWTNRWHSLDCSDCCVQHVPYRRTELLCPSSFSCKKWNENDLSKNNCLLCKLSHQKTGWD